MSITDKQTVAISAPVVKEVQTVVFEDWATETPLETVWSLEMSCGASSCDGVQFYFSLFETNSGEILIYDYVKTINTLSSNSTFPY